MMWIALSIVAAIFFSLRQVVIKRLLHDVNIYLMALAYRVFGLIFILPLLIVYPLTFPANWTFWKITFITSLLTAIASLLQIKAIQKYELSLSVPFLSFVPLFMILPVFMLYHELPGAIALVGVLLLSVGSVVLSGRKNQGVLSIVSNMLTNRGSLYFLGVAFIFSITSTLDRSAIAAAGQSAFVYTFYWHVMSALFFSFIFFHVKKYRQYAIELKTRFKGFLLQGLLGMTAFISQMLAIVAARTVEANVLYIKAITLVQLIISVLFGIYLFKEKHASNKIIGAIIMIIGAVVLILVKK
jgi:drug/metabolite transporter (DMT)-like permease